MNSNQILLCFEISVAFFKVFPLKKVAPTLAGLAPWLEPWLVD